MAAAIPIAAVVFLGPASNAALFGHQAAITPDRLQGRVVSVVIVVATVRVRDRAAAGRRDDHGVGQPASVLVFAAAVAGAAVAATVSRGIRAMQPIEELAV